MCGARAHALTSFIKASENKTTTIWLACSKFASFNEDTIAALLPEKDSKSTEGLYQNISQEYLRHKNITKRFKAIQIILHC